MHEPYLIFQSFTDPDVAQEVAAQLQKGGIPFQLEDTSSPIDPVLIGSPLEADIRIKLRPQDFAPANALLQAYYTTQLDTVDPDYYLLSFSDDELEDLIRKPDEWGQFDYLLAQRLLKQRGKEVPTEALEQIKEDRIREVARPESVGRSWIYLGYFLSVFFSPLGIFFGSIIVSFRKTLPNGQRVYAYSEQNRRHGRNILMISATLTVIWLLFTVLTIRPL